MHAFFSERLDINIIDCKFGVKSGTSLFLPDEVVSYEQLILGWGTHAALYTTEDITAMDESGFSGILNDLGDPYLRVYLLQGKKKKAEFDRGAALHVIEVFYSDGTMDFELVK